MVEYLGAIGGPGMDADMAKSMQKILSKQGMKFKLNTKVLGGDVNADDIKIKIEAAKGGKEEQVGLRLQLVYLHKPKLIADFTARCRRCPCRYWP